MKLLLVSDRPLVRHENRFFAIEQFNRFAVLFREWFDTVVIACRVTHADQLPDSMAEITAIDGDKVRVIETSPWTDTVDYFKRFPVVMAGNFLRLARDLRSSEAVGMIIPAPNTPLVAAMARLFGKPYFCFCAGDQEAIVRNSTKYKGFVQIIARVAAAFNAASDRLVIRGAEGSFFWSDDLCSKLGTGCAERSFVIFASSFQHSDLQPLDLPPRDGKAFSLVYSGRLSHEKNIAALIEAIARLDLEGLPVRLEICGDGPERDSLETLVRKHHLTEQVRFSGRIKWGPELFARYRSAHLLILPSLSEGLPHVLLEAMACGCPVIATRVGGIPDIVTHLENGILIEPGSTQAIVNAVKRLASDEELRRLLAENGHRFALDHTAEKQAEKMALVMLKNCGDGKSADK